MQPMKNSFYFLVYIWIISVINLRVSIYSVVLQYFIYYVIIMIATSTHQARHIHRPHRGGYPVDKLQFLKFGLGGVNSPTLAYCEVWYYASFFLTASKWIEIGYSVELF
jgi:hypothetical protein